MQQMLRSGCANIEIRIEQTGKSLCRMFRRAASRHGIVSNCVNNILPRYIKEKKKNNLIIINDL